MKGRRKTNMNNKFQRTSRYSNGGSQGTSTSSSRSSGAAKSSKFTRIASLTKPKKHADSELGAYIDSDLRGSPITLNAKVYLPKGTDSLELKNGNMLLVSFNVNEKDKDFVIGHLLLANE